MLRGLITRTPTAATHVHVGMPDPATAINAYNGLRRHLPLLQALSANSPFWFGVDSGFDSSRAQLFRAYPRATIPPAFRGFPEYEKRDRGDRRRRRDRRLHVPVVGRAAAPAARDRRGPRDGRAVRPPRGRRPRRARPRPRAARGREPVTGGRQRRAHGVELPRRPRRPARDDLVRRRAAPGPRRRPPRGRARPPPQAHRPPSRRSSGSSATATAPTASAPSTRATGMPGLAPAPRGGDAAQGAAAQS